MKNKKIKTLGQFIITGVAPFLLGYSISTGNTQVWFFVEGMATITNLSLALKSMEDGKEK